MLSPHTAPGTIVVCIDAQDCEGVLHEGARYTVRRILRGMDINPGSSTYLSVMLGVELEEVSGGKMAGNDYNAFGLRRFRKLELPKVLTDLLIPEMV